MTIRVRVDGTDRVFAAQPGDDLLEVLQANGEPIATSCGGVASCGLCRVTVVSGGNALVPIKPQELVHLGNVARVIGLRLACQAAVRADLPSASQELVVRIPELEDVEGRKRRKAERTRLEARSGAVRAPSTARGPRIEWRVGRPPEPQDGKERKGGV